MSETPIETSLAPWLLVHDGPGAVEFYARALGATPVYRLEDDDARVVVARLRIDAAEFWVQEDTEVTRPGAGVRMIMTVADPDALFDRAVSAGATPVNPVAEEHGWRAGRVSDPFGHDWEFAKPV